MGENEVRSHQKTRVAGIHYETGANVEIIMSEGYIQSIREVETNFKYLPIVAPGLVDLQVNGYKGFDFNQKPLSLEEWLTVIKYLLSEGVTTFYPTIITNSFEELSYIFNQNQLALKNDRFLLEVIGGFHLEGPYISKIRGPRGAHPKEYIKPPHWDEFCQLQDKADGQIKIITLSPEWEESMEFIKRASQTGVKISIGHTAANTNDIRKAVESGAILSTHLGNGAHPMLPRHPNYIWDQLAEERLWASVISDGHHLPVNVLDVFNKVKGSKLILVSDSVALAGMKPGDYQTTVGGDVTLTENGQLHLKHDTNLLAGSAQNLLQGVQHFVTNDIAQLSEAINKASIYPAELMGIEQKKGLSVGAPADIIQIDIQGNNWKVKQTYKKGKRVI